MTAIWAVATPAGIEYADDEKTAERMAGDLVGTRRAPVAVVYRVEEIQG